MEDKIVGTSEDEKRFLQIIVKPIINWTLSNTGLTQQTPVRRGARASANSPFRGYLVKKSKNICI